MIDLFKRFILLFCSPPRRLIVVIIKRANKWTFNENDYCSICSRHHTSFTEPNGTTSINACNLYAKGGRIPLNLYEQYLYSILLRKKYEHMKKEHYNKVLNIYDSPTENLLDIFGNDDD